MLAPAIKVILPPLRGKVARGAGRMGGDTLWSVVETLLAALLA